MVGDYLHQPFAQALTSIIFQDAHISDVGIGGIVSDNPGEANLIPFLIYTKV